MLPAQLTSSNLHDPILPFVSPVPVTLRTSQTLADAHAAIRAAPQARESPYFYVLDDDDRLAGTASARHLLTGALDHRVEQVMNPGVLAIPSWATVLIASEYFVTRKLKAFPVIADDGTLAGTVSVALFNNQVLSVAQETYNEIFQLLGVHVTSMTTPWTSYLDRFPWLLSNMAGGLLCALIASRFEGLLQHVVVLSLFIPVVLTLAEAVSIQSLTLTLQNLSDGPINWAIVARGVAKEFMTALMLGLGCGSIVGVAALAWKGAIGVGLVLTLAITVAMITACLLGVLMPTALRALKADPKIAAGPIVLALTDLATLLVYFNLAGILLG